MDRILNGVRNFEDNVFPEQRKFFELLASKTQAPRALFITCADSRIHPNMITTTDPGELFLIRNAGNIIPPYSAASHGEGATIEYAISVLHISNIIVCGHSQCGAMEALLRKDSVKDLPAVAQWFSYAEGTRRVAKRYEGLTPAERARAVTQQNVLVQIQNLNTHPCVISGIEDGNLKVFGWYYDIGTGRVFQYRQEGRKFEDISLCGDHVACNGTGINSLRGGMHGPNLYLD